jgi:hypothetical protein
VLHRPVLVVHGSKTLQCPIHPITYPQFVNLIHSPDPFQHY